MNKADLIARVSETTGLPKATTEVAVNTIFTAITDSLAQGDSIAIAGFGTFNVKSREARKGRNPRTGDEIDIPAAGAGPARRAPCGSARAAPLSMPSVAPTWADTPFPLLPSDAGWMGEGQVYSCPSMI